MRDLGARPVVLCTMNAYPEHVYGDLFGVRGGDSDVVLGDVRDTVLVRKLVADSDYVIQAAALADVAACTRDRWPPSIPTWPALRTSWTPSPRRTACAGWCSSPPPASTVTATPRRPTALRS
ncbi:hypothetical protein [Streptomyces sp. NPDC090445]|uniref:hypothetical protein n=1 Tax=Streptomyces sp. NPDC090445 TaxID=3365963 RepID=UPI0038298C51